MIAHFPFSHMRAVPHGAYTVTFDLNEKEPVLQSTFVELLEEQARRVVGFTDDGITLRLYEGSTIIQQFYQQGRIDPLVSSKVLKVHWFVLRLLNGEVSISPLDEEVAETTSEAFLGNVASGYEAGKFFFKSDPERAQEYFKLFPDDERCLYRLYLLTGDRACLEKAAEKGSKKARNDLGVLEYNAGNVDAAKKLFNGSDISNFNYAQLLRKSGFAEAAESYYDNSKDFFPSQGNLGVHFYEEEDYKTARAWLEDARYPHGERNYALFLEAMGDWKEAAEEWKGIEDDKAAARCYRNYATVLSGKSVKRRRITLEYDDKLYTVSELKELEDLEQV